MMTCSLECSKPERQYYISLHKTVLFFWPVGSERQFFIWLMLILSRLRKNKSFDTFSHQQQGISANVQISYAFKDNILLLQTYKWFSVQLSNIMLTLCNNGWNGKVISELPGIRVPEDLLEFCPCKSGVLIFWRHWFSPGCSRRYRIHPLVALEELSLKEGKITHKNSQHTLLNLFKCQETEQKHT